ncbi:hypothetical protein H8N03_03005 [Ramlibacter sp. USB13]|uniref:Uncharacterized protein n=1 Tax=Ramlibacter cellulosilyticus TaxID=2764187 RepID=A0A923MNC0_9BURK|nr:hypothetical protein [Ramlibacter cellulosilyticus]MBC5781896.1 hypothetical protein [Ramlibacter cellulosilyticus]
MHLVQLLLPVFRNDGSRQPQALFAAVRQELVDRFGGLTAYNRAPAEGLWSDNGGSVARDDIVVYEVMVEDPDRAWWAAYRTELGRRFGQEELVVRAQRVELL